MTAFAVLAAVSCSSADRTGPASGADKGTGGGPPNNQHDPYSGPWQSFTVGIRDLGPFTVDATGHFTVQDVDGIITPGGELSGEIVPPAASPPARPTRFTGRCPSLNACVGATIAIGMEPSLVITALR
jgi:hypothetical protein